MRNLGDYIDDYGLIVQSDLDGGDSANRVGLYGVASEFNPLATKDNFNVMAVLVEPEPGLGIRHPDPDKWYSKLKYFSRDQHSALILGGILAGNTELVKRFFHKHLSRFGAYQNFQFNSTDVDGKYKFVTGDIASPEHWGYYIRGLNMWYLYPLLPVCDLFMLINSLVIIGKSWYDADDTSNDLNHIAALLMTKKIYPTPVSWLARKVYKWFRSNAGVNNENRLKGFAPQTALDHYFRVEAKGPPINELFAPFLEKEL